MTCAKIRKQIQAYTDNQLPLAERGRFEKHLETCAACRELVRRSARLNELLFSDSAAVVPDDLTFSLQQKVRARRQQRRLPQSVIMIETWWREASPSLRAAASFLLIAALSLGTLMSWRVTQRPLAGDTPVIDYALNSFAGAPDGSLENAYLTLLDNASGGER